MEEEKKSTDWKKSAPVFDISDPWKTMELTMRLEDWKKANERLSVLSAQNTEALMEAFRLGFLAGVHFTQDTFEKERH